MKGGEREKTEEEKADERQSRAWEAVERWRRKRGLGRVKKKWHTHAHTQRHGDAGENLFIVMSFLFLIGQL